jgi:hypothetical protein
VAIQTGVQSSIYEQTLVGIVRTLPVERVLQVLDFARYVQTQVIQDFGFADETEDEILADEAQWDAQFAITEAQGGFAKMAEKVRADIRAGRTRPMAFTIG